MFEFELEKGSKKFTCPNCGAEKKFKRYVRTATGEYVDDKYGRCDRENSCDYHKYPPKDFFPQNQQSQQYAQKMHRKRLNYGFADKLVETVESEKPIDTMEAGLLLRTLTNYENNNFVKFLLQLFPEDQTAVWQAVRDYLVGTTKTGMTIFWQIEQNRKVRTGKIMLYDVATGKRRKDINPTWSHFKLKELGLIEKEFKEKQCFFGEHLLLNNQKPVAIVEAEKTAVIASICFPEFVWLSPGGKGNLKTKRLESFSSHKFILYPDGDGFDRWQTVAQDAQRLGLSCFVSTLIENRATAEQKRNGYDLADFLIEEQQQINKHNLFVDKYNALLDRVLNDETLMNEFNRGYDAQIDEVMQSRNMPKATAEARVSKQENIRQFVLSCN